MKTITKIMSLLLAMLMLTSVVACGGKDTSDPQNNGDVTTAATTNAAAADTTSATEATTEAPKYPALPEKDMQGYELRFLNYDDSYLTWSINQLDANEVTADLLSDAIYERNTRIEETYNCVISEVLVGRPDEVLGGLVASGDVGAEVVLLYDEKIAGHYTSGRLLTWDNLSYIDYEQPYWSYDATQTFNVGGKIFAATGDFSLSMSTRSFVLMYNKDLYSELGLKEDLYQLARDGKWTMEKMVAVSESAVADLNGDGAMNAADDRFGSTGSIKLYFGSLVTGAGVKYVERDAEGGLKLATTGNEYAINVMSDILAKHNNTPNAFLIQTSDINSSGSASTMFRNGQTIFQGCAMKTVTNYRDMESDFGILPFPKYSEEQESYHALTSGGAMATLPVTLQESDYENVGLILEAMSRDSYESVVPTYKEIALKSKYARDAGSADMLDIIFSSATYDVGLSLLPGDIYYRYMNIFLSGKDTFASGTKSMESIVNKQLQRLSK